MAEIRMLGPGDEDALDAYLAAHAESSILLRSNLYTGGLNPPEDSEFGPYAATTEGDSVTGVAAFGPNAVLLVQAGEMLPDLLDYLLRMSDRKVHGLSGPAAQVTDARHHLGFDNRPARLNSREILFSLNLENLRVPEILSSGTVQCRMPHAEDLPLLAEWRRDYEILRLGAEDGPALRTRMQSALERLQESGGHWVLSDNARLLSYAAYTGALPDIVQIGGVWTPPELRNRGYGRAVVAGSLLAARKAGVEKAVLFTGADNLAAQRSYRALGFQKVGHYGIIVFGD